jgi:hypothetical protein
LLKYKKMLKMMPQAAVEGRMTVEGISKADQDLVLGKSPVAPVAVVEVPLPEHLAKYKKMLKMMPEQAVVGRMTVEGVSPADQKLVLSSGATTPSPGGAVNPGPIGVGPVKELPKPKPAGPKLTGLFWDVIDRDKILDPNQENLWKLLFNLKPGSLLEGAEAESLVALFTKKDPLKAKKEKEEALALLAATKAKEEALTPKSATQKPKKKTAKVLSGER